MKNAVKPTLLDFSKRSNEEMQQRYSVEGTNGSTLLEIVVTEEAEATIEACWDRLKKCCDYSC